MQQSKIFFAITSILLASSVNANNLGSEIELLKTQLMQIQKRILELEKANNTKEISDPKINKAIGVNANEANNSSTKNVDLYVSLRPTFGRIDDGDNEFWDVRDALSNAGIKSTFEFSSNWKAILHGEWGIDLSNNGDFGKARQVYVALDSPYGQVGIGKQRPVQYSFIAEYVDIFNHSLSPFAYDPESPFFVNNLLTYKKQINAFTLMLASQFDGENANDDSDFFNAGVSYDSSGFHLGLTYSKKDRFIENNNTGSNLIYAGSIAYTFDNDLYLAAGYQNIDYEYFNLNDRQGHTFDMGLAYPINKYFKFKTGYFDFEDGLSDITSQNYQGANITFEWLPADGLRFHLEYLYKDFDVKPDFSSYSLGFRYDLSKKWEFN